MRYPLPPLAPTALALAFALTAASCGGSTAPTPVRISTSTTAPDRTPRIMATGLLRASDLPSTWKDTGESAASASTRTQIERAKTIPACREFADTVTRENQRPKASSNKFVDSTAPPTAQGEVSNDVVAWRTAAEARAAYGVYSARVMRGCLDTLFRKLVTEEAAARGAKVTVAVEDLPVPAVGDAAIGYQAVVSITAGTSSRQIAFIVEIVRVGRYTVSYNATLYKAAPTGFGKNLAERSISRLEAAG